MSNYSTAVNDSMACSADLMLGFKSFAARNGWLYAKLERCNVSALCVKIYRCLVRCCGDRAYTLIHWNEVAARVGCGVRHVKTCVARLVEMGFVRRVRRGNTWRTIMSDLDPITVSGSTDDSAPVCSEPAPAPAAADHVAPTEAGAFFAAPAGDQSITGKGSVDPLPPFNDSGSTTRVSYEPLAGGGHTHSARARRASRRTPAALPDTPAVRRIVQWAHEIGQPVQDLSGLVSIADRPVALVERAIMRAGKAAGWSPVGFVIRVLQSGVIWDRQTPAPGFAGGAAALWSPDAPSAGAEKYASGALGDLVISSPDRLPPWLHGGGQ